MSEEIVALDKEIETLLRAAQGAMFNGKHEQAADQLATLAGALEKVRAADAGNAKLAGWEQKARKLQQDVDKRLNKAAPAPAAKPAAPAKPTARPAPASSSSAPAAQSAPAEGKLPSGVSYRMTQVEAAMGKNQEGTVVRLLKELDGMAAQIPEGHPEYAAFLAQVHTFIDACERDRQEAKAAAEQAAQEAARIEETSAPWIARLLPFTQFSSGRCLKVGSSPDTDELDKRREPHADAAHALEELAAATFTVPKSEKLAKLEAEVRELVVELGKHLAAAGAEEAWLGRLRTYAWSGPKSIDPDELGRADVAQLVRKREALAEAQALLDEYRAAGAPTEPREVGELAQRLGANLEGYAQAWQARVDALIGEVEAELTAQLETLQTRRSVWERDETKKPLPNDNLPGFAARIEPLAALVAADDTRIRELQTQDAELAKERAERRRAWTARTYLQPESYAGADAEEMRALVSRTAEAGLAGAKALRTVMHVPDWKETSEWEWTDTTKSARRFRTTRTLWAQAAVKSGSEARRLTVCLQKDKREDGTWSEVRAHVAHNDLMLEAHVAESRPEPELC